MSPFTFTGWRACGRWPAPSSVTSVPPRQLGDGSRTLARSGSCRGRRGSTSTGQRTRSQIARASSWLAHGSGASSSARISDSAPPSSPQPDAVLDLLRRVRLAGSAARRRTRGSRGSRGASSGRCTSPSPRRCRAGTSDGNRAVVRMRRRQPGHERARSPRPRARCRVGRGEHQRPAAAVAERRPAARLGAVASSTARPSPTNSHQEYASAVARAGPSGRSRAGRT